MHGGRGPGLVVRQNLPYGRPSQRILILGVLVAGGAVLIAFGTTFGAFVVALGVVLGVRLWGPNRLRAPSQRRSPPPQGPADTRAQQVDKQV